MEKFKLRTIYWLLILLLIVELAQAVVKIFTPYYFHAVTMGILALLLIFMGIELKIKKAFVFTFGLISLILSVLKYIVVWN